MTDDPIDGEVVDDERHNHVVTLTQRPTVAVAPSTDAGELVARLNVIRDAMTTAMEEGIDYGRIPGIDKPTLFKPGAEKLGVLFQLDVQIVNEKTWGPGDHLTVSSQATVYHAPTGTRLGYGEGMCSTREKKYGKRKLERQCPSCGAHAIIKGKEQYGGGWVCWKKKDGCGTNFPDGDQRIEAQPVGEIENPELPDTWNTVVKMSEKRARVDAVLAVTGASALFTQDAEDMAPAAPAAASEPVRPDIPPDWPPRDREPSAPPPVEDVKGPTFAADMAGYMVLLGLNDPKPFREFMESQGVEVPSDLRAKETRLGVIKGLTLDKALEITDVLKQRMSEKEAVK